MFSPCWQQAKLLHIHEEVCHHPAYGAIYDCGQNGVHFRVHGPQDQVSQGTCGNDYEDFADHGDDVAQASKNQEPDCIPWGRQEQDAPEELQAANYGRELVSDPKSMSS